MNGKRQTENGQLLSSYPFHFQSSLVTINVNDMNIFAWMLFAFINTIILFSLDYNPGEKNLFQTFILGFTGALSSSVFIYFLAKGMSPEFTLTFSIIVTLEAFLLTTLLAAKSFKNIKM